jgi:hypothetical protein
MKPISDDILLQFKDEFFRIDNSRNEKLNIDRHILWLKPSDVLKRSVKSDRIINSLYPLKIHTYIYNYLTDLPHKIVFSTSIQKNLKGFLSSTFYESNNGYSYTELIHLLFEHRYRLNEKYIKSQLEFLRTYGLSESTVLRYVRNWVEWGHTPVLIGRCKSKFDLHRRLFFYGFPLDVDHTDQGGGSTRIYHAKDEGDKRSSRLVCEYFAKLFGLQYKDYLYYFRDGVKHYIKFDSSGLDFTCIGILLLVFYLNVVHGLRGIDLIKALGNSKLVRDRGTVYEIKDHGADHE